MHVYPSGRVHYLRRLYVELAENFEGEKQKRYGDCGERRVYTHLHKQDTHTNNVYVPLSSNPRSSSVF